MTKEQKYQAIELDGLKVDSLTNINYKPHPYTIGPKHIEQSNGILGEDVCRRVKCAHCGCNIPYDQHTYDTVLVMKLTKDLTQDEARTQLQILIDAGVEADNIDGFVFVESGYKFI